MASVPMDLFLSFPPWHFQEGVTLVGRRHHQREYGTHHWYTTLHYTTMTTVSKKTSQTCKNGQMVSEVKIISFNKPTLIGNDYSTRTVTPAVGHFDCYMITGIRQFI